MKQDARGVPLLDEFSSTVDADTDRLMQTIIQPEFARYTAIRAAHVLDTTWS
jgi:ABC-type transport system involved in cytochrome bd biosynthesis fused ATPase/permease subunit